MQGERTLRKLVEKYRADAHAQADLAADRWAEATGLDESAYRAAAHKAAEAATEYFAALIQGRAGEGITFDLQQEAS